jgi:ABC-type transporter Mla MlaB component
VGNLPVLPDMYDIVVNVCPHSSKQTMATCALLFHGPLTGSDAFQLAHDVGSLSLVKGDVLSLHFDNHSVIDVSGVAVLVRMYSHLSSGGVAVQVAEAPYRMHQQLADLGLDSVFGRRERPRPKKRLWPSALRAAS